ncbi:uncharacterized protein LOC112516196 [Cynara cardunculus var. scolymus]|uniref:uncharacterized protein LOC112516196 n=1 Tax=Cynara cardunculus var. scolymus TaxID=59895 RepID=UPI000D6297A5|nr:uncharacterized protein LOC112516196 [Cynara cardunculus var. scolymus]
MADNSYSDDEAFDNTNAELMVEAFNLASEVDNYIFADATDEYVKIGESTVLEALRQFCRAIVEVFGDRYHQTPNANNVARLLQVGEQRGFPGMLVSLDCMHWKWKNCPTGWGGQYSSHSSSPSIILEVVADYDLWIWHAYFGLSGSNNDINVLESSHLFANLDAEDERDINAPIEEQNEVQDVGVEMMNDNNGGLEQFLARHRKIKDKDAHFELRNALIDHLWDEYTNSEN